jgi:hypothetical protein
MNDLLVKALKMAIEQGKMWPLVLVLTFFMVVGPALVSYGGGWFGVNNAMEGLQKRMRTNETLDTTEHLELKLRVQNVENDLALSQVELRELIRSEVKAALFDYYQKNGVTK